MIDHKISVEVLLEKHPLAADWLLQRGIVCLRCGEPFWGSIGELLTNKGHSAESIESILGELNTHLSEVESS